MVIASHVCKSFSEKQILRNISFHIRKGETVGFIGLNGSGKTTLMQLLTGTLRADSGYIRVAGENPWSCKKRKNIRIGMVSANQSNLHPDRTTEDSINLCKKMYPGIWSQETMNYAGERMKSGDFLKKLKSSLSTEERMRAEFLYAITMVPQLLIMDEPTIGMDFEMRTLEYGCLEYFLKQQAALQTTVLLVIHNIQEMRRLCKRVIAIHNGQIIFDGAMEHLQRKYLSLGEIYFEVKEGSLHFHDMPINRYEIDGKKVHMIFDKRYVSANVILQQLMEKAVIKNIKILDIDMDTIIQNLYQESERRDKIG